MGYVGAVSAAIAIAVRHPSHNEFLSLSFCLCLPLHLPPSLSTVFLLSLSLLTLCVCACVLATQGGAQCSAEESKQFQCSNERLDTEVCTIPCRG